MGGFVKYDGDDGPYTIAPEDLKSHLRVDDITKEAIKDKSKGDLLSKGFAILQTGWFILQCIARKIQGLAVTEIEIVTLGFAALNFATYALWWNKPLDVRVPFVVRDELGKNEESGDAANVDDIGWNTLRRTIVDLTTSAVDMVRKLPVTIMKAVWSMMPCSRLSGSSNREWDSRGIIFFPLVFLSEMGGIETLIIQPKSKRVPTFYAGKLTYSETNCAILVAMLFATIFGAIHCVAWSFEFPSPTEQLLWRISSLAITSGPVTILGLGLISISNFPRNVLIGWWGWVFLGIPLTSLALLYILARVTLLVLAFMSLRLLPSGAYHTVNWTTFIPHI
jgi:hypothetical protein